MLQPYWTIDAVPWCSQQVFPLAVPSADCGRTTCALPRLCSLPSGWERWPTSGAACLPHPCDRPLTPGKQAHPATSTSQHCASSGMHYLAPGKQLVQVPAVRDALAMPGDQAAGTCSRAHSMHVFILKTC
jgi:hypothetical protein